MIFSSNITYQDIKIRQHHLAWQPITTDLGPHNEFKAQGLW